MLGGNSEYYKNLGLILGAGGALGYFIANKYNKSKTLGVVIGIGVTFSSLYAFNINVRDFFATKTKEKQLGQKLDIPLTSNIDVNTIPNEFTVKSDGYNTTYSKRRIPSTFGVVYDYSKISGRTDGSIGMGSPNIITSKEFEEAYNKFLQQPK